MISTAYPSSDVLLKATFSTRLDIKSHFQNEKMSEVNSDLLQSKSLTTSQASEFELSSRTKSLTRKPKKSASRSETPKRKRKRKDIEISRIPGVRRIVLSELSQKIINCIVGEHVTSEKPWIFVKKELIQDNIDLHEDSSEFLPIRNEIISYPRDEILIGYVTEETGDSDEFYICVTEAATDAVLTLNKEQQAKQEARLENAINKIIKSWTTLGSEKEINEGLPRKNRALLEVEIESQYPILPFKIEFRLRTVEKARDGYMELTSKDESVTHVFRKNIDNETQVTPVYRSNEAQTFCTYPSNASTQYEYVIEIDENLWKSYGQLMLNFFRRSIDNLMNSLYVNRTINLYVNDYQNLSTGTSMSRSLVITNYHEYMSFHDVQLCKGKMISCFDWHKMWSGILAVSYADLSPNIILRKQHMFDEVSQAVHGINPVLIWSFVDPLNPRLILETHREISVISICPFNENLVVGGAVNGQIVLWDITNRIQKVEEQEILTNSQIRYRIYMNDLMGWMKNIHNNKLVRSTAVSDLRHSHSAPISRIQWISPYEEVGRTGKPHQVLGENDPRSLQFMTGGDDGVIMFWDLLKKPTFGAGGFRERRLKRLKQKPAGLSSDVSPYRVLHLNLKPIYKINLIHPQSPRPLTLSMIRYRKCLIEYIRSDQSLQSNKMENNLDLSARQIFHPKPIPPKKEFVPKILIGTMEGDYGEIQWEGRDFDLGAIVNSENCTYTQFSKFHDGPVFTISKQKTGNLILTTGGKIFAIWSDKFRQSPVFWRRGKHYYNHGSWYHMFPDRFRMLRCDGIYELWCLTAASKKPSDLIPMTSGELIRLSVHPDKVFKHGCIVMSDSQGNCRTFIVKNDDAKSHNVSVNDFINKEIVRKQRFMEWQKQWCERNAPQIELPQTDLKKASKEDVVEATNVEEEKTKKDSVVVVKKKTDRPPPGRYLEWVREKELAKEHERIKKMILKKKSLDTEQLEKQRIPLLKLEAENELRRKKQRARIKGSEKIFTETVAMLFPAIVKEKPPPPPDPYAGGDPVEAKEKCFAQFATMTDQAERYMKNTTIEFDFNWKNLLKEGRNRRRYLDMTFSRSTHNKRYAHYKASRENPQREPDIASIVTELEAETVIGNEDQANEFLNIDI